jgi:hypothetical protein
MIAVPSWQRENIRKEKWALSALAVATLTWSGRRPNTNAPNLRALL